ncbi:gluconate 2-dehydrogenase subunit 3 family protein [Burkholderiaceae bacterium DAT-1]|nr:gluconate 2-dehydrogenase subunit 3 family protein [Burkholderiaceae bacterium DAT-1]
MHAPHTRHPAGLSRRFALKSLLTAVAALASLPVLSLSRFTAGKRIQPQIRSLSATFAPMAASVFTSDEAAIVTRLVTLILPTDGTAGAAETGTPAAVISSLSRQDSHTVAGMKQAIAAIDGIARQQFGQTFTGLPDAAANTLTALIATNTQLAPFWAAVRSLAVLHFYAQPAGYQPLGMPGPNLDKGGFPAGHPITSHLCQRTI